MEVNLSVTSHTPLKLFLCGYVGFFSGILAIVDDFVTSPFLGTFFGGV